MCPVEFKKRSSVADTLIHVDESLNIPEREKLVQSLREMPGVFSPGFNPHNEHLLIVAFDPEETKSTMLLRNVKSHGYHAELIGL